MRNNLALVTGGSGFVGRRLIQKLSAHGWQVRAIGRSAAALAAVQAAGATPFAADLQDAAALRAAVSGCTAVFHAAAHFKLWGPPAEFAAVNIAGTAALLQAAREAGSVRRFVQIGAAAVVMGEPAPLENANESLPVRQPPWAPYSASKAQSEKLVHEANSVAMSTCVLRPPLIWGAHMPTLNQMAATAASGQFRWPGGGLNRISTCHVDNLCHATHLAAGSAATGAFFITDSEDRSLREVITALLATRGVPPPKDSVPFPIAWQLARFIEFAWRFGNRPGEPPLSRQMLRLIGLPFTLDSSRARNLLGYSPIVTWADGLAAMRP